MLKTNDPTQLDPINLSRSDITAISQTDPSLTAPTQILEAQGWAIAPNGEMILTASAPTVTPNSSGLIPISCNGIN